jgi:hypothetical protein
MHDELHQLISLLESHWTYRFVLGVSLGFDSDKDWRGNDLSYQGCHFGPVTCFPGPPKLPFFPNDSIFLSFYTQLL